MALLTAVLSYQAADNTVSNCNALAPSTVFQKFCITIVRYWLKAHNSLLWSFSLKLTILTCGAKPSKSSNRSSTSACGRTKLLKLRTRVRMSVLVCPLVHLSEMNVALCSQSSNLASLSHFALLFRVYNGAVVCTLTSSYSFIRLCLASWGA